jgi:hypothetical protein
MQEESGINREQERYTTKHPGMAIYLNALFFHGY